MITNNTLRISGLASGMNTDEIVANLVKAQSSRLNKMQQSKTLASWKTDAYRDVNKKVDEFHKAMRDLRLQSTFNKQTVSSSLESVVSATVSGTPTQSSYEITDIQPATPAKATSVKFFLDGGLDLDTSKKLSELTDDNNDGKISLIINSTHYEFSTEDTVASVLDKLSQAKVASYSSTEKSLTFTNSTTGPADISIDGDQSVLEALKIQAGSTSTASWGTNDVSIVKGTNAEKASMKINGLEFRSDSNKITYDGVTFEIKSAMESGSVTIATKNDTDAVFNSIKTFVDKYNDLIADLNGRLTEKKYREYLPLLDEQKKDMKENDIKLWEEKAKSGLLSNDSTISSFLAEMRNSLSTPVGGVLEDFNSLKDIGISFSSSYRDNGKLELNEEKLKGLLQTNLEDIKKLFSNKGTGEEEKSTTVTDKNMHDNSGFGWRIYERLNVTLTDLSSIAGSPSATVDTKSNMAKQIKLLTTNIDKEQDKINTYESRLWKQFTAMEKALSQLNSQSSWLSQQLGM